MLVKPCVLTMCPQSERAQTLLLRQIFNYSIETHMPPTLAMLTRPARVLNCTFIKTASQGPQSLKIIREQRAAEGLIGLISAAHVKCVAASGAVGRVQAPWLAGEALRNAVDSHRPH